jgi:ATP-dependent helicase/nuclease subunit A
VICGASPQQILAVTFTRKAAADMRSRVRQALQECLLDRVGIDGQPLDDDDLRRIAQALDEIGTAPINTIHGFCADLLRRFPIEADVDPGFTVLEPAVATERAATNAAEYLETIAADPGHPQRSELQQLLNCYDFSDIARTVSALRSLTGDIRSRLADRDMHRQELAAEFRAMNVVERIIDRLAGSGNDDVRNRAEHIRASAAPPFADLFGVFAGTRSPWGLDDEEDKAAAQFLRDHIFGSCHKAVADYAAEAAATERLDWLLAIAGASDFPDFLSAGELDYDRLEAAALRLLADPEQRAAVRRRLDLTHILVDEYQDANTIQQTIVYRLLGLDGPEAAATGLPDGPPWFFAVGDPKQSIYRFRNAEVEVFRRTAAHIRVSASGRELEFTGNWRSTPELVAFYNHLFDDASGVFSHYLRAEPAPYEPCYTPMCVQDAPTPPGPPESPPVGCFLLPDAIAHCDAPEEHEEKGDELSAPEATWIAKQIAHLTRAEDGSQPEFRCRDIAVLKYSVRDVSDLTRELDRYNIPHFVVGTRALLDRLEVRDVISWLRVLARPDDDLALVSCAKQPWIGLTDRDLWTLKCSERFRRPDDVEPREGDIPAEDLARSYRCRLELLELDAPAGDTEDGRRINTALARLRQRLESLKQIAGRVPVAELVERIVRENDMRRMWAGWRNPALPGDRLAARRRIANVEQFVILVANGADVMTDPANLLDWLGAVADSPDSAADAQLLAEDADVVRIMTIHQAKGLEFPVVFVMRIDSLTGSAGGRGPLVNVIDGRPTVTREAPDMPITKAKQADPLTAVVRQHGALKDAAEKRRLFYVAVTRAEKRLFLSGKYKPLAKEPSYASIVSDKNAGLWLARRYALEFDSEDPAAPLRVPKTLSHFLWPGATGEPPAAAIVPEPPAQAPHPVEPTMTWQSIVTLNPSIATSADLGVPAGSLRVPEAIFAAFPAGAATKDPALARQYGDLFHAFMAQWDFDDASADALLNRLVEGTFGDDAEAVTAAAAFVRDCVTRFNALEFSGCRSIRDTFAAALADGRLHRERPFTHWRNSTSGCDTAEWVSGTIDVLLEADGGVHIYDYKTGTEPPSHYAPQMQLYGDAVQTALGTAPIVRGPVLLYVETTAGD